MDITSLNKVSHKKVLVCTLAIFSFLSLKTPNAYAEHEDGVYPCRFMTEGVPAGLMRKEMQYSFHKSADGIVLIVEGEIKANESQRLYQAIRQAITLGQISEVWLNSGGGNAIEGMKMGRVLRKTGVPTRIPRGNVCFSACSYAFLGGPLRIVEEGGEYGVHMFTASSGSTKQIIRGVGEDVKKTDQEGGFENTETVIKNIEQSSALFAATFIEYLSEMGISTKTGIHNFYTANQSGSCPPPKVLKRWNIINIE